MPDSSHVSDTGTHVIERGAMSMTRVAPLSAARRQDESRRCRPRRATASLRHLMFLYYLKTQSRSPRKGQQTPHMKHGTTRAGTTRERHKRRPPGNPFEETHDMQAVCVEDFRTWSSSCRRMPRTCSVSCRSACCLVCYDRQANGKEMVRT